MVENLNLEQIKIDEDASLNSYTDAIYYWVGQVPTIFALYAIGFMLVMGLLIKRYFYLLRVKDQVKVSDHLLLTD